MGKSCRYSQGYQDKGQDTGYFITNETFDFFFGTVLCEMIFRHTDNLNMILQKKTISAAEGQQVGKMVINTVSSLRNNKNYGKK